MTNALGTQDPTDIAEFECIATHGIDAVTMEMIARRAGWSRATFYRQFPSWRHLVRNTHHRAVRLIGWWAPRGCGDLRFELEWWWSTLQSFFASDWGRAFLVMRPHAACGRTMAELERAEVSSMPDLAPWTRASAPIVRAVWALALTAACPTFDETDRAVLRDVAYAMLSRTASSDDDAGGDWDEVVALATPL
jgi:AcrR family transcriptional regulator